MTLAFLLLASIPVIAAIVIYASLPGPANDNGPRRRDWKPRESGW